MNEGPAVSVIVPTYQRKTGLLRLLDALEAAYATGPSFEVVVSVDGATDGTAEALAELTPPYRLTVTVGPNRGPAHASNRAIEHSRGEVLLFLDDDVVPVRDIVDRHLGIHRRDPAAVVVGPMLEPPTAVLSPWLRWEAVTLRRQYDLMRNGRLRPTARQFYTANASVRRENVIAAGLFDERYLRNEDVEFAYRLTDRGLRIVFEPAAIVFHEPDRTLERWLAVAYEYGRHDVLLERAGRRHVSIANAELVNRNLLSQIVVRTARRGAKRTRVAVAALAQVLGRFGDRLPAPAARFVCSALFQLRYWEGVRAGTGGTAWHPARGDLIATGERT